MKTVTDIVSSQNNPNTKPMISNWLDAGIWSNVAQGVAVLAAVLSFFALKLRSNESAAAKATLEKNQRETAQSIAEANQRAQEATERGAKAQLLAENTRLRANELGVELEKLRKENIELERGLSPRFFENQARAGAALKQFKGTEAQILYADNPESKDLAGQIAMVLHLGGWKIQVNQSNANIAGLKGITLSLGAGSKEAFFQKDSKEPEEVRKWMGAPACLLEEMHKSNLQAESIGMDFGFPMGVVIIHVGQRPNAAVERRLRAILEERRKRMEAEKLKSEQEPGIEPEPQKN